MLLSDIFKYTKLHNRVFIHKGSIEAKKPMHGQREGIFISAETLIDAVNKSKITSFELIIKNVDHIHIKLPNSLKF